MPDFTLSECEREKLKKTYEQKLPEAICLFDGAQVLVGACEEKKGTVK